MIMKYISTILVTVLILIAVLIPGPSIPDIADNILGFDKVIHFCMFYVWSIAIRFDFQKNFKWPLTWLTGASFGVLTEILQLFAEDRTFDYFDMLADAIGVSIGLLTGAFVLRKIILYWPFKKIKSSDGTSHHDD